jgi:hypothetical protein
MRIEGREAIWFGVIVAALAIIFLAAYLLSAWGQGGLRLQSAIPGDPPSTWDTRMFALDRDAADEAYKEKMKQLFDVWLRSGDIQAPDRAIVGAINARRAYRRVMEGIERRETESLKAREQEGEKK